MLDKTRLKHGIILSGIILFYYLLVTQFMPGTCLFKNTTGLPCPGCGLSRAGSHLIRGDILGSLYYHALLVPIVIILVLYFLGFLKKVKDRHALIILIIVMAYYFIRMILFFPHQAPFDYQEGNFISWLIHTLFH